MKIELPKLTKTQKIIAAAVIVVAIAFLVWGCGTAVSTEVKTDSTEMKIDSVKVDSVKVDTLK
jgi:TRAP-type C4-dicarboxylate transport system permease small subunit